MMRITVAGILLATLLTGAAVAQDEGPWKAASVEGMNAVEKNDLAHAEQSLLRAVRLAEEFGPRDVRVASTLNTLGLIYRAEHKFSEAEAAYRKALPIMETAYGANIDVANLDLNLVNIMFDQGHAVESMPYIEHGLSIYEKLLGDSSIKTGAMLCMKGDALRLMKRYVDAEGLLRVCSDIREKNRGLTSPELAEAQLSLARVLSAEGKASAAEARYQLVEKIREKSFGITSPLLADSMDEHAVVLRSLGRYRDAEKLTAMSSAIRKAQGEAPSK
jgi:tetratricopeptide (TPR) repeat protein